MSGKKLFLMLGTAMLTHRQDVLAVLLIQFPWVSKISIILKLERKLC